MDNAKHQQLIVCEYQKVEFDKNEFELYLIVRSSEFFEKKLKAFI